MYKPAGEPYVSGGKVPIYVKLSMLLDVSRELWYLHAHHPPIVHQDLSPNNVLLTSQFVAKISGQWGPDLILLYTSLTIVSREAKKK